VHRGGDEEYEAANTWEKEWFLRAAWSGRAAYAHIPARVPDDQNAGNERCAGNERGSQTNSRSRK